MSASNSTRRRLVALPVVVVLLLALAALWQLRPALPTLPASLHGPLTIEQLVGAAGFAAWLALAAATLQLLGRTLRAVRSLDPRRTPPATIRRTRPRTLDGDERRFFASAPYVLTLPERAEAIDEQEATQDTEHAERSGEVVAPPPQRAISVSLLGPLAIDGCKRGRRALRSASRELIAYLALHPEGASREQLPDLLWPNEPPERARRRLWQSVTDARAHLGDGFQVDGDRYLLDRNAIHVDVDELERLLAQCERSPQARTETLERALTLIRGEPLAGSDYLWADGDIRRLRAAPVELLLRLAQERLAAGEPRAALTAAERGLGYDPLNEELWRLALEAEATLGLREAVIDRYEDLTRLLDERLGLEPDRETRSLYRSLLGQS